MSDNYPLALTFDDIQLIPNYSSVESREDCDTSTRLVEDIKIKIPVISSPMDTVTESGMINALNILGATGVLHRFMSLEKLDDELTKINDTKFTIVAVGATDKDDIIERIKISITHNVRTFLIDIAHGNSIHTKRTIELIRHNCDNAYIIAGNIATYHAALHLIEWGVNGLRIGIGNGCFTPNMKVKLENGIYRPIKDIEIGDKVYTHTEETKEVIDKFEFDRDEEIMEINGIECTKNHKFYAVHKKYENVVNNIEEYAEWIKAEDLTDDYMLVEI